jgi:hypothetical protein
MKHSCRNYCAYTRDLRFRVPNSGHWRTPPSHDTSRLSGDKSKNLIAPQLLPENDRAIRIHTVRLKSGFNVSPLAHRCRRGGVHPINFSLLRTGSRNFCVACYGYSYRNHTLRKKRSSLTTN